MRLLLNIKGLRVFFTVAGVCALLLSSGVAGAQGMSAEELLKKYRSDLGSHKADFSVEFGIKDGKKDFKVGDEVVFTFKSDKDCYLYLIDQGTSGEVTLVYPLQGEDAKLLTANTEHVILPPDSKYVFRLKGPVKNPIENVIAIASDKQLDVVGAKTDNFSGKGPFRGVKNPGLFFKDLSAELKEADTKWATKETDFTVTE